MTPLCPMLLPPDSTEAAEKATALAELERYCEEHPRSPSAIQRPRVILRGRNVVALLGSTMDDAIAGIGSSVSAALEAFDAQYRDFLKTPKP